jgi:transcriptional regulator with XRE-family HTH domain
MKDTFTTPNSRLRKARLAKMWPIREVAERLGVNERTVLRWEQGIQLPRLSSLSDLCELFRTSAEKLGFGALVTIGESDANEDPVSPVFIEQMRSSVTNEDPVSPAFVEQTKYSVADEQNSSEPQNKKGEENTNLKAASSKSESNSSKAATNNVSGSRSLGVSLPDADPGLSSMD